MAFNLAVGLISCGACSAFTAPRSAVKQQAPRSLGVVSAADETAPYELVLVRHGESTWNDLGLFTGWHDCPLSVAGEAEAKEAGRLLKEEGFNFSLAYTSYLKRAISTLWIGLTVMDQQSIPVQNLWRLNERHYGDLQGKDKKSTVAEFGSEQVNVWRRSYDVPPPECSLESEHYPANDPMYAKIPKEELPRCESLKLTEDRVLIEWEATIKPAVLAGEKVIIAAHGNTLRALVKMLDDISPDVISELNIPTGVPLVYELDRATLKPIKQEGCIAPLQGRYLGDLEQVQKRIGAVAAQSVVAK